MLDTRRAGAGGQGNYFFESVQRWADAAVLGEYRDITEAFVDRYGDEYAADVVEVLVSRPMSTWTPGRPPAATGGSSAWPTGSTAAAAR